MSANRVFPVGPNQDFVDTIYSGLSPETMHTKLELRLPPANQTLQAMVSTKSSNSETLISARKIVAAQVNSRLDSKKRVNPLHFKYYIHDAVDSCRMQLFGHLSEASVKELNGCWMTAKTCLAGRKIILDLRNVTAVDEAGTQWTTAMVNDGAVLLPETFLAHRFENAAKPISPTHAADLLTRILAIFRGSRTIPAQSPTQAQ